MNIEFDPKSDVMYIRFNDNRPRYGRAVPKNDEVILHVDADGNPVGVELLGVSQYITNLDAMIKQYATTDRHADR